MKSSYQSLFLFAAGFGAADEFNPQSTGQLHPPHPPSNYTAGDYNQQEPLHCFLLSESTTGENMEVCSVSVVLQETNRVLTRWRAANNYQLPCKLYILSVQTVQNVCKMFSAVFRNLEPAFSTWWIDSQLFFCWKHHSIVSFDFKVCFNHHVHFN